jgi:hypothetical protein
MASGVDTENKRIAKLRAALTLKASTAPQPASLPVPRSSTPAFRQVILSFPPAPKLSVPEGDKITYYNCGNSGYIITSYLQRKPSSEFKDIADDEEPEADIESVKNYI